METTSVEKLESLMKRPVPFLLAALHEVIVDAVARGGEVDTPALGILVEHGLATNDEHGWTLTRDGINSLTEADHESYYSLVGKANAKREERWAVERQAKARANAEDAVKSGALVVVDGVYRLTALARQRDGESLHYRLFNKRALSHFYWAGWEGVKVGKEYERSGAVLSDYMDDRQWNRIKKRILASMTDSERALLIPPQRAQKPLSKAEQLIKDMILAACQKVKEG